MTQEEAERTCNIAAHSHVLADRSMEVLWDTVQNNPHLIKLGDFETEQEMFEAISIILLHGLMSLCKDRECSFEELLKEARQMEADTVKAYVLLENLRPGRASNSPPTS